jgi:hypothetical protein
VKFAAVLTQLDRIVQRASRVNDALQNRNFDQAAPEHVRLVALLVDLNRKTTLDLAAALELTGTVEFALLDGDVARAIDQTAQLSTIVGDLRAKLTADAAGSN